MVEKPPGGHENGQLKQAYPSGNQAQKYPDRHEAARE